MRQSTMIVAVLQALALFMLGSVINHHRFTKVWDDAKQHEIVVNFTRSMELAENATKTVSRLSLPSATEYNGTNYTISYHETRNVTSNSTASDQNQPESESFYRKELPRAFFVGLIAFPLAYYWQIWLEKTFPARPKPSIAADRAPEEKVAADGVDESREEAVVQKWIAQGKIRRASLSWWNTLVKWTIDLSIGTFWKQSVNFILEDVLLDWTLKPVGDDWSWLKWEMLLRCVFSFVDIRPLAALIAYIVIPAHKRIVFVEGVATLWCLFFGLFFSRLVPYVLNSEFARMLAANVTANMADQHRPGFVLDDDTRLMDEL